MDSTTKMVCPVCGGSSRSADFPSCACGVCGFGAAFVDMFPNEKSRLLWLNLAEQFREKLIQERRTAFSGSGWFTLGSSAVALYLKNTGTLYIIRNDGTILQEENAVSFSSSERNYSILYADGTVRVFGTDDANYGLLRTENWKGMKAVLSAPNCTYAVSGEGKIIPAGSDQYPVMQVWDDITKLASGTNHILGLKSNGKVVAAGKYPDPTNVSIIEQWSDVVDIAATRNASLALHADGKVSFAGRRGDARYEVQKWDHICGIAMDNTYAVGLTENGKVLLAGSCKPFLDKGRSSAAGWNKIIAVSCRQTGIGAITESGEFLFVGLFPGDLERVQNSWNQTIKNKISLK